ncbi:hypothetical protein HA402_003080 [Bradysia odoriphaga]|nr:hypothetical protein HA402_003080 [Bradysia odoriphaga]
MLTEYTHRVGRTAQAVIELSDVIEEANWAMVDVKMLVNPTRRELQSSELELVVSATKQHLIVKLDKSNVILLPMLQKAIKKGAKDAQTMIQAIEKQQRTYGKTKREMDPEKVCSDRFPMRSEQ